MFYKRMITDNKRLRALWPFLMEWEGRDFEDDRDDPGGATKFGIDQRSHPTVDIRKLTEDEAFYIYAREWEAAGCDNMPSPKAEVFFDTAVNLGLGRARDFDAPEATAHWMLEQRDGFYRSLAERRPVMRKFLRGWLNRTADLRRRYDIAP